MNPTLTHDPVLLEEVLDILAPKADETYLDATFGRGGYAKAILDAAPCQVVAMDRDFEAVEVGQALAQHYPGRLKVIHGRFSDLESLAQQHNLAPVQGIVFDLGVSSPQLDNPSRGFSFQHDGPLDMGMGLHTQTAAEVVNGEDEKTLADILWHYGGERRSRAIAKAIAQQRLETPFETTHQLAKVVRGVVRRDASGIDPATRTFQALRMYINNELEELWRGLCASEALLKPNGVLVVVSFHSGEDGFVKDFFALLCGKKTIPSVVGGAPTFVCPVSKPLLPSREECQRNPRARSARLRWGKRTQEPAWAKRIRS